jgi:hypothetical protein
MHVTHSEKFHIIGLVLSVLNFKEEIPKTDAPTPFGPLDGANPLSPVPVKRLAPYNGSDIVALILFT